MRVTGIRTLTQEKLDELTATAKFRKSNNTAECPLCKKYSAAFDGAGCYYCPGHQLIDDGGTICLRYLCTCQQYEYAKQLYKRCLREQSRRRNNENNV